MTKQEEQAWLEETAKSAGRWNEDPIWASKGDLLLYRGGESGRYIEVRSGGHLTKGDLSMGTYDGALPHIGEAIFQPLYHHTFTSRAAAIAAARRLAGR